MSSIFGFSMNGKTMFSTLQFVLIFNITALVKQSIIILEKEQIKLFKICCRIMLKGLTKIRKIDLHAKLRTRTPVYE
jgi:hypothetical protein